MITFFVGQLNAKTKVERRFLATGYRTFRKEMAFLWNPGEVKDTRSYRSSP